MVEERCTRCHRTFVDGEERTEYEGLMLLCARCQEEWELTGWLSFGPTEKEELERERTGQHEHGKQGDFRPF
jgi:hypothetical protein